MKGSQLNGRDATSWYTGSFKAAAKGLSDMIDWSFVGRPAASKGRLRQIGRTFSLRDTFSLPGGIRRILLLRIKSQSFPARWKMPTQNLPEFGRAASHFVLGRVQGRQAPKLLSREFMASGAILKRSFCSQGYDPKGVDLHIFEPLCPVCSIWPVVRGRVVVGDLIFPSFQLRNLIRRLRSRGARLFLGPPLMNLGHTPWDAARPER